MDGRLHAVSRDGKMYVNEHRTDGNLSAHAMVIGDKEEKVLIISADLCGFEWAFIDGVRKTLSQTYDLPGAAILFNATHTHFSPVAQSWPALGPFYAKPNAAYMKLVRDAMLTAASDAVGDLKPANLFFGRGTTEIGSNRRSQANPDAPYDNTLDVIVARNQNASVSGILFMTGCHPVFRNAGEESFTISGNYPATAREMIRKHTDAKQVMFLQGFGGDINPQSSSHKETGTALAEDVLSVVERQSISLSGGIRYSLDTLQLPIETWSREKILTFREENERVTGDLEAERNVRWSDVMLDLYNQGTIPSTLALYVQILTIGDWKLVGLSREVVNEYGPAIRAIWPDKHVSVAGYCNDVTSYLPADWHITSGVYEGHGSFYWYNAPGTFPTGTFDYIIHEISRKATK